MKVSKPGGRVILDVNDENFLEDLLNLEKHDRHSALETLKKLRHMTLSQVSRDQGLKWEKIHSIVPPAGIAAIYSLRITQSRRATAFRDRDFLRFLTIAPDHDSTYGKR